MQFFKEFLNSAAKIVSYGDGKIMLKTKIGLNIVDIDDVGYDMYPVDKERKDVLNENGVNQINQTVQQKLDNLAGERFTERTHSKVMAEGTIYGRSQLIINYERKHSYYGMNKRYLTTEGLPNELAILKRLRETNLSQEVKEGRINRLYNSIFTNDFYDNATSLLYVLYTRVFLYRFWADTSRYDHNIKISFEDVKAILMIQDTEIAAGKLKEIVERNPDGFGMTTEDDDVYDTIRSMRSWMDAIVQSEQKKSDNKAKATGTIQSMERYQWDVKIWKMYKYDDGHSFSGRNFGRPLGFVQNRFKVPMQLFVCSNAVRQAIRKTDYQHLASDASADQFGRSKYFLNITNLSPRETSIVNQLVQGVKRATPFLVDQDIPLIGEDDSIDSPGPIRYAERDFDFTDTDIINIINKMVTKHRWHEDFASAAKAARFWLAQPSTETVESHWWLSQSRRLHLPLLGLKRAALGFMLLDEGVCTTQSAIDLVSNITIRDDSAVIESLCMNTYWYWGEVLARYNKETQEKLECAMESMAPLDIDDERRAEVMVSSITGRKVDLAVHSLIRTEWDIQLEDNFNMIVPFGKINFNNIGDYGYKLREDNNYILNTIPTPGATAIIVGLSGSLIAGTPLSSIFCSGNSAFIKEGKMRYKALMFNDLWATGMYLRWQGHDIKYKYPMTQNRHVVFAANSVGIAMPPVLPPKTRTMAYILEGVERRENTWISDIDFLCRCNATYRWSKSPLVVQQSPEWSAPASVNLLVDSAVISKFKGYVDDAKNYIVALEGKYGIKSSGFHMAYVTPAVPLDPRTEESQLREMSIDPDPGIENSQISTD